MIDLVSLSSIIIINRCIVELYYIWFYNDSVCEYFTSDPLKNLCEMIQEIVWYKYYYAYNYRQNALSYLILGCTAAFTLVRSHEMRMQSSPTIITYYLVIANSALGCMHYYLMPKAKLGEPLEFTDRMMTLFLFPCFVSELWYKYGYAKEFAYIHILMSIIPTIRVVQKSFDYGLVDAILTFNIASAVCISLDRANWYGIIASIAYIVYLLLARNYFVTLPARDAKNYALGVFLILSMRALSKCCCRNRFQIK